MFECLDSSFKIQEGLLSENVKTHLHNKITHIKHHFPTIGEGHRLVYLSPFLVRSYHYHRKQGKQEKQENKNNTQLLIIADK